MSYMEIRNLKKVYNPYGIHPKVALNGLDFEVEKGDFICIMGASGSGKTTLVNILSTIDEATHGQIFLNQKDLLLLSEKEKANLRKEEIGFIFQNYNLLNSLTIYENIMIPLKLIGEDKKVIDEKVHQITRELDIESLLNKYPHECSGGQQQRLCIARALAVQPEVILLDEPTSALDPISTSKIEELTLELKKDYTIVIVTHNMQQAMRISDKTAFFLLGDLIEYSDTETLFSTPKEKKTEDYITGRFG